MARPAPLSAYGSMNGTRYHAPPLMSYDSTATSSPSPTGSTMVPITQMSVLRVEVSSASSWNSLAKLARPTNAGGSRPS